MSARAPSTGGLSQTDAQAWLVQYGYNELPEKRVNPLLKLLTYFNGPIPWMIEAVAILSALVRHWPDFFIIRVLLVANAAVGFWEEYQAGNAIVGWLVNDRVKLAAYRVLAHEHPVLPTRTAQS
jgi:H+-transporting ATPase